MTTVAIQRVDMTTTSDSAREDLVPEGFERHSRHSGLTAPWEPIYLRPSERGVTLAIRSGAAHANSRGFVHGGLVSALADNAMGLSCARHLGDASGLVTVSLSVDFVGTAKIGQWVEFRGEVVKPGRSICFASALVFADDAVCARASSVFRVLTSPAT